MITDQQEVTETVTIAVKSAVSAETAQAITRAMKALADFARIYKKYGPSAKWHAIASTYHEPKRAARLRGTAVPIGARACGRCGLPFVAKTNERCMCKVKTKRHAS